MRNDPKKTALGAPRLVYSHSLDALHRPLTRDVIKRAAKLVSSRYARRPICRDKRAAGRRSACVLQTT